jgi:hypothetical protein
MKLISAILKLSSVIIASTMLTGCASPGGRTPVTGGEVREHPAKNEGAQRKASGLWAKQLYRPAEHPRLALATSEDARGVLVCYDERHGSSPKNRRRAYWLLAQNAEANERNKPKFTNAAACRQLNPIPLMDSAETNAVPSKGYAALVNPNSLSFQLWWDGEDLGVFELPVYWAAPPATFWRVGVTVVIVAAVIVVVGICLAAQGPRT